MNMFESYDICKNINDNLHEHNLSYAGAFDLCALGLSGDIKNRIKTGNISPISPLRFPVFIERVNRYINKKFNYLAMV